MIDGTGFDLLCVFVPLSFRCVMDAECFRASETTSLHHWNRSILDTTHRHIGLLAGPGVSRAGARFPHTCDLGDYISITFLLVSILYSSSLFLTVDRAAVLFVRSHSGNMIMHRPGLVPRSQGS